MQNEYSRERQNLGSFFLKELIQMGTPEFLDSEQKSWTLDSGRWTLDSGRWTLVAGLWMLDSGPWTLDSGRWRLDAGLLTLNVRL